MKTGAPTIVPHQVLIIVVLAISPVVQVPTAAGAGYVNPTPTGITVPPPSDFHSYQSLVAELIGLNMSQPALVTINNIGTSWQNRSIYALRITNGVGPKKNILFMGLHHANEWMSEEVVTYLIHYFLANARDNPRIRSILEKANVWFIPVVNPDGFDYSLVHDNLWRKNRRDNGDGTLGVDLNRNYGYRWGAGGFGLNTSDIEYQGPEPFSEPETQAIRDFSLGNPPVFSISYHTAGGWILFPWSYTSQPSQDDGLLREYALEMSAANGYRVLQEGKSNHVKAGNSDDWLYATFGTLAFTFEVGPSFSSQDSLQIAAVVTSNVEPAVHGAELALHLKDLNCTPKELLCVPALSIFTLGIPLFIGSVYFGARIKRRRHDKNQTQAHARLTLGHQLPLTGSPGFKGSMNSTT